MVDTLDKFVKVPSWSYNPQAVNDLGRLVQSELNSCDLVWDRMKPESNKYGDWFIARSRNWNKNYPNIFLSGHLDTVFKDNTNFNIRLEGNKYYGPGSIDMKSGLVIIVETIKKLQENNKLINVGIILSSEEEIQSESSSKIIKSLASEINNLMVFEGNGSGEQTATDSKNIVVKRKGFIYGKLNAQAQGGHSGVLTKQEERHSAVHELVLQGKEILSYADFSKNTTTNLGIITGGSAVNALAQSAELHIDARVESLSEFKRMITSYSTIPDNKFDKTVDLKMEIISAIHPLEYTNQSKQFFTQVKSACSQIGIDVQEEFRGGGSDANRLFADNNSIAILDNFGGDGGNEHTDKEFVYIDSIPKNIDISYQVITSIVQ